MPEFEVIAERGRFVLGGEEDSYGIWELDEGADEPIERFAKTDEGFEEGWDRFRRLYRRDRNLVARGLRLAVVVGFVLWLIGTIGYALLSLGVTFDVEPETESRLVGASYALDSVGFRLGVAGLIGLAVIAGWRRWLADPTPSDATDPSHPTAWGGVPGIILLVALAVWTISAFVTTFYRPNLYGRRDPALWMTIALLVDYVAFRFSLLMAAVVALRWFRRSRDGHPAGLRTEEAGPPSRTPPGAP